MSGGRKGKKWTAAGAARAAREARIATVDYLRHAPIARRWHGQRMREAHQLLAARLGGQEAKAAALLFNGMGYPPTWSPTTWLEAVETVLADEAGYLAEAELYILSPRMCDVVIAAAQTLTHDDLGLITEDDPPSPCGLVVLPHPLLVKGFLGDLADDRAYLWRAPVSMAAPNPATPGGWDRAPAVRISGYHDTHGPIRPSSFLDFAAQARAQGTPLPPLLLESVRCHRFDASVSEQQRRNHTDFVDLARQIRQQTRELWSELGIDEEQVIGEYTPGAPIEDPDGEFVARFLYAFWRLCEQRIATVSAAEVRHAARVTAERAGVPADVRVVRLRAASRPAAPDGDDSASRWQHRWVVRMHKVRQWYPTEQRHKVIYRGPYIKGPDDKPLLDGETVRGLVR